MHRYNSLIKLKAKMTPNKTNSIFKGFWNESSYFRFQPSKSQDLSFFSFFFWDRGALEQVLRSSKRHMIWCRISWLSLLTSFLLDSYKIFWFMDKNRWELTCFCFVFCLFLTMHHALSVCSPFQHSSIPARSSAENLALMCTAALLDCFTFASENKTANDDCIKCAWY